jgi:glutamate N-acetyltransferase/amino-acid N-acetyltransferase
MKKPVVRDEIDLPKGFKAAGLAAGIKKSGAPDMALIVSDGPAAAAGTFTTNQVKAAPVRVSMDHIRSGNVRAILANSGNANACTGKLGLRDAKEMAVEAALALGVNVAEVLVCSTGPIGLPMPMEKIRAGIPALVDALSSKGGAAASDAIRTTDKFPKHAMATLKIGGKAVTVSGMCKGAGMIHPGMATMLCFLLTDVRVSPANLRKCLREAVGNTFNAISVDGDMSTNDTVFLLANGASGATVKPGARGWKEFCAAVEAVAMNLALKIVRDGEGATKIVGVNVKNARSDAEADLAARAVANSLLVKTCWAGDYPNWGRIMDAIGYSRARVDEAKVDIWYDGVRAVKGGVSAGADVQALSRIQKQERFNLTIDLKLGKGRATVYTCDIGHEYIDVNVDYIKMPGRSPS